MNPRRPLLLTVLLGSVLLLGLATTAPARAQVDPPVTPAPTPGGEGATPPPGPVPTPTPTPGPGPIQQIIYSLLFPAETISQALANVFMSAAEQEAESLTEQAGDWALLLGQVVQAPQEGYYQSVAEASLPVAAALAPALFLLRLALYHWRRLVGEDDSALQVAGDWVASGALAVAAGPFLDLVTQLGWWLSGAALGETAALAQDFIAATTVGSAAGALLQVSLFSGVLLLGVVVGGVLAMAGMLFAFAAAQAALFVLAVLGPPLAVGGVLRHMRWLRSLWIKAVAVLVLLPVAAGGIFKAGVALSTFFAGGGLLSLLIRLLWLWGATGFLLALAGVLGRVTLSASVEALGQLTGAVKAIAATAVLAGMAGAGGGAAGTAGGLAGDSGSGGAAGLAAGGAGLGGPGSGAGGGEAGAGAAGGGVLGGGGEESALGHLDRAQAWTRQAGVLSALGLHAPAGYARTQARLAELAARKSALEGRLDRFVGTDSRPVMEAGRGIEPASEAQGGEMAGDGEVGFSPSVDARLRAAFPGSVEEFGEGFQAFAPHIEAAGLNPELVAQTYPEDTARMVRVYLDDPQAVSGAADPLQAAARRGRAEGFRRDVYGRRGQPADLDPETPPMDQGVDTPRPLRGTPPAPARADMAEEPAGPPPGAFAHLEPLDSLLEKKPDGDREEGP